MTSSIWIERLSLIELILKLTSFDELSLVIPGEGLPVNASALDLNGDISLVLPAWRGGVSSCTGDCICLHKLSPAQPSKSYSVITGCVFRRWSCGDSVISVVGFPAYVGTKRFLVVKMPTVILSDSKGYIIIIIVNIIIIIIIINIIIIIIIIQLVLFYF